MPDSHVLILGGGTGGLFTGALLAKEGFRVTVLEKNRRAGGGLQCFERFGTTFETGMHTLGGLEPGDSVDRICRFLGIRDRLKLRPDDCLASIHYLQDGSEYLLPKGKEAFTAYLCERFPAEATGIRDYIGHIYRLSEEVDLFYLRESDEGLRPHSDAFLQAADELIGSHTADARLRDVLAFLNPLYGGVAGHSPAYLHALINVLYINGPCRFVGGSQQLAEALTDVIQSAGGTVETGNAVTAVDVKEQSVTAIHTADGRQYRADQYISSIHPCTLLGLLPPDAFTRAYRKRLQDIPDTYSAFTVFVKLRPHSFPYMDHTCYYQDDYGLVWRHADAAGPRWPRGFMYFTPPEAGQDGYARKLIVNCVMDFDEVAQWADTHTPGQRGKAYEAWKRRRMCQVLERLETLHPGFGRAIEQAFAASPLTIRDYYGTRAGSLFGYRKDCKQPALSYLPVRTKIRNLLLTGQNVNLHGICGVPLTAIATAEALLGRNYLIRKMNEADGLSY